MENVEEKQSKTILIIDDEQSIVDLLVYNLQKEGYKTLEANDGLARRRYGIKRKTRFSIARYNVT